MSFAAETATFGAVHKSPSPFFTQFAALEAAAWSLFFALSVLMAVVLAGEIGEAQARAWLANADLQAAATRMLAALDGAWITLAAINTYIFLARAENLHTARRWASIILTGSAACAWIGARTGFPFGPLAFTDQLGMRLGRVLPFTLPLLWFVVVLNSRYVALRLFPRLGHWPLAAATAALAVLTDGNLEPVAWKMRAYWLWYPLAAHAPPWPPPQNFVSWFAITLALAGALHESRVAGPRGGSSRQPVAIFATLNAVWLVANLARMGHQI